MDTTIVRLASCCHDIIVSCLLIALSFLSQEYEWTRSRRPDHPGLSAGRVSPRHAPSQRVRDVSSYLHTSPNTLWKQRGHLKECVCERKCVCERECRECRASSVSDRCMSGARVRSCDRVVPPISVLQISFSQFYPHLKPAKRQRSASDRSFCVSGF